MVHHTADSDVSQPGTMVHYTADSDVSQPGTIVHYTADSDVSQPEQWYTTQLTAMLVNQNNGTLHS